MEQAVPEELQPVGRTHVVKVCGRLFPVGGKHAEGREGLEEEAGAETRRADHNPMPYLTHATEREGGESGMN